MTVHFNKEEQDEYDIYMHTERQIVLLNSVANALFKVQFFTIIAASALLAAFVQGHISGAVFAAYLLSSVAAFGASLISYRVIGGIMCQLELQMRIAKRIDQLIATEKQIA